MAEKKKKFISKDSIITEQLPHGKHYWYTRPDVSDSEQLVTVRVTIEPGDGHAFHKHPDMEEILYILSGEAEQWVEKDKRVLGPDEVVFIPENVVHATYNSSNEPLEFLAILSPSRDLEGSMIDVSNEEPWCNLRD